MLSPKDSINEKTDVVPNIGEALHARLAIIWIVGPVCLCTLTYRVNTLRPRKNGRHFADDTFKRIVLNEYVRFSIKISLKCLPKGPISNIPALVQIIISHYLNQWWVTYRRIYASLGLNELKQRPYVCKNPDGCRKSPWNFNLHIFHNAALRLSSVQNFMWFLGRDSIHDLILSYFRSDVGENCCRKMTISFHSKSVSPLNDRFTELNFSVQSLEHMSRTYLRL